MNTKEKKNQITTTSIIKGIIPSFLVCLALIITDKINNEDLKLVILILFPIILIVLDFIINYKFKSLKKDYLKINLFSILFYLLAGFIILLIVGDIIGSYNSGMLFLAKMFLDFIIVPVLFILNLIIDSISKKAFKDN